MVGRPRTFDIDQATLLAMERFWSDGYEATTVASLTSAIGISPPSLYAAFGGKEQLFDRAAARYVERIIVQVDRALERPGTRDAIGELLRVTAAGMIDEATPRGCFLLGEPRLAEQREEIRSRLRERLARGIDDGDLAESADADALADYVMTLLVGMAAQARDGASRTRLDGVVDAGMLALPAS